VQTIPGGVLPAGSTGQTLYNTGGVWTATTNLSNDGSTIGLGSFTNADVDEWPKVQWLRVGTYDEGLIKGSSSRGVWGRAGFGIHMNADKHFGFFSSGWDPLFDVEGGTGRTYVKGNMGLGTNAPSGKLHVATNHANGVFQDGNDRPSIGVTGVYPQMVLMSGNSGNVNHGATVMLGGFDAGASGAHKHWSIGTSGQNSSFLDIGFSSDLNPHGGIRNYSGTTVLTLTNGGLMGLGTLSPSQKLDVAGNVTANIYYDRDNTAYYANPNGYSSFNQLNVSRDGAGECCSGGNYTLSIAESTSGTGRLATIQFHNGGASEGYLRLANSGAYRRFQLGDYQSQGMGIELTGRITFDGTGPNGYRVEIPNIGNATGRYLGNDYYLYSSNRWKQDIKTIENPLDKIRTLRGVEYNLTKEHGGTHASGFIAEELGKSLPHLADYEEDGVSVKAVSYMGVIPYVVEGVKALDMNQSTQSEKLLELQKRLEEQNALIELMRKELEELKKK
ncbi:MAG TPA: tail fiber domain-containing protein, partial [Chitinophagales bacterium]|nr:tail fiber domain-containing protein [Chitinophagales bacterium]